MRHITCLAHVRQLTLAIEQYVQDHHRYPGANWHVDIEPYIASHAVTRCPTAASSDPTEEIDYGYNGLLVQPDFAGANAQGFSDSIVMVPRNVGVFADARPWKSWWRPWCPDEPVKPPIIGRYDTGISRDVGLDPRHNGINIGYCDGHAEFIPGKLADTHNLAYKPARAFYHALALGMVTNYAGGLGDIPVTPTKHTVLIGGDGAGMPLLMAAAEFWAAKGGKWFSRGCKGSGDYTAGRKATFADFRRAVAGGHYAWLTADDGGGGTPVAKDALVFIVAKNCTIASLATTHYDIATAELARLYAAGSGAARLYTYDANNGNRAYLAKTLRRWGAANGKEFGPGMTAVRDDLDMVAKVAADPNAIGYCSSSVVDIEKVTILALGGKRYPNQNPKYPTIVRDTPEWLRDEFEYPLIRTLRLHTAGDGASLAAIMRHENFKQGPLFAASYFPPD